MHEECMDEGAGNEEKGMSKRRFCCPDMGEKNCISPDVPGQLLKKSVKRKATSDSEEEANKDLRSRGLYQVPGACTLQVGSKMELITGHQLLEEGFGR